MESRLRKSSHVSLLSEMIKQNENFLSSRRISLESGLYSNHVEFQRSIANQGDHKIRHSTINTSFSGVQNETEGKKYEYQAKSYSPIKFEAVNEQESVLLSHKSVPVRSSSPIFIHSSSEEMRGNENRRDSICSNVFLKLNIDNTGCSVSVHCNPSSPSVVDLEVLRTASPVNSSCLEIHLGAIALTSESKVDEENSDPTWDTVDNFVKVPKLSEFELLSVLGAGAYGKVFLARHVSSDSFFALKVMRKSVIIERDQIQHTKSERDVLTSTSHPFLVTMHCAFQTPSKLYLVLDYIPGGELYTRLNEQHRLVEDHARFYIAEIILALEYLHTNHIIYRDLKPENILLGVDGHVVLTDFGLAKYHQNEACKTFCGTVEYMAPEVINRQEDGYGAAADWWSVGAVLFEMLTGKTPFEGGNRKKVEQNILNANVVIPKYVTYDAQLLIKGLLRRVSFKRLGFQGAAEIKKMKFFSGLDWNDLLNKKITPPFIPNLKAPHDASRFEKKFTTLAAADSPCVMPMLSNSIQDHFRGFSFDRLNPAIIVELSKEPLNL